MKTLFLRNCINSCHACFAAQFPYFCCRNDKKWFRISRNSQNYALFSNTDCHYFIFFIIKYTFIAKTSDKDIRLWLYSFVILMAENWLIHRWIRSLNAQYISNPLGSLLGYMKLQWKKKLITFFFKNSTLY